MKISHIFVSLLYVFLATQLAAAPPPLVIIGDSISEGVQSADASWRTQRHTYAVHVARRMGLPLAQPLIDTAIYGVIYSTDGRTRLHPARPMDNLAVSGATVNDVLYTRADAVGPSQINSETDLVLHPYLGSQVEIAEYLAPERIICWIGNNDVLGAVLAYDHYDASQITPLDEFQRDYRRLLDRLHASGARLLVANIPDVTSIGFLIDAADLEWLTGYPDALPPGHYAGLITALLLRLDLESIDVLKDPNYVLDPAERQRLFEHTQALNAIIAAECQAHGTPYVDANALLRALSDTPPVLAGVPVTTRFLGGILSLDGVHPSATGHALIANACIDAWNQAYGEQILPLSPAELDDIARRDPHVDLDGDRRVRGRPGAGLVETLTSLLRVTGDRNEHSRQVSELDRTRMRQHFVAHARALLGLPASLPDRTVAELALRRMFGRPPRLSVTPGQPPPALSPPPRRLIASPRDPVIRPRRPRPSS